MGKIITFTGGSYTGRTTITLNTAVSLAKEGKILVVDADQSKGNFAAMLDLEKKSIGLEEAVTSLDSKVLAECIIKDKKTGLSFLTLPKTARANDLLSLTSNQADSFYKRIKNQFDYILIDAGNILYESLSGVALFESDKVFVVLTPEKRGSIWMNSNKKILSHLDQNRLEYISVNLAETPEIPAEQIFGMSNFTEIPWISNMRDYAVNNEIFVQKPSGRKAADFIKKISYITATLKE